MRIFNVFTLALVSASFFFSSCQKENEADLIENKPIVDFSLAGEIKTKTTIVWGRPSKDCMGLGFCYAETTIETTHTHGVIVADGGSSGSCTIYFPDLPLDWEIHNPFFGSNESPLLVNDELNLLPASFTILPDDYFIIEEFNTIEIDGDYIECNYKVVVNVNF